MLIFPRLLLMQLRMSAETECVFAGKPLVPSLVECIIWQQVTCSWTPSVQEQKNHTGIYPKQQILLWSRGYEFSPFQFVVISTQLLKLHFGIPVFYIVLCAPGL